MVSLKPLFILSFSHKVSSALLQKISFLALHNLSCNVILRQVGLADLPFPLRGLLLFQRFRTLFHKLFKFFTINQPVLSGQPLLVFCQSPRDNRYTCQMPLITTVTVIGLQLFSSPSRLNSTLRLFSIGELSFIRGWARHLLD